MAFFKKHHSIYGLTHAAKLGFNFALNFISLSALALAIQIASMHVAQAQDADKKEVPKASASPAQNETTSALAPSPTPATKAASVAEKPTPLDPAVQLVQKDDAIPTVYKDMVVVQRKAKEKAGHFLFSTFATLDFSDGPITNYAWNTNVGYAINDFWEIYLDIVPFFVTVERPIVGKVQALTLANGQQATITYAKPTFQYGVDLLWLPAYGKESWGAHSIVRSDTFFKFGAGQTKFASGDSGFRMSGMVGKTYFLSNLFNIRVAAGVAYAQTVVDTAKTGEFAPVLEAGLVFYF